MRASPRQGRRAHVILPPWTRFAVMTQINFILLKLKKASNLALLELCRAATLTLCLPIKARGLKPAGAMKALSGTFALKLMILVAGVTASIISGCETIIVAIDKPIIIKMNEPGMKVSALSKDVQDAFDKLIAKHGPNVCNVDYYDKNQHLEWHRPLTMTGAVRSKVSGNPAPADPINLMQKVAFANFDEAQKFFSSINP